METDAEKERKLRRAQYREKQDTTTEGERQERNEWCRAAYRARISAANRRPDDHEASSSVQVANSAGGDKAESSFIPRRIPRIELQQKELQLEKLRIAKRDRRNSLTENQKEEILEKLRKAYEILRARVCE